MKFSDICIITSDVIRVRKFYEHVFGVRAEGDAIHASILVAGLSLAIYNKEHAITDMGFEFDDCGTGLMTLGFNVDDADQEYVRIVDLGIKNVTKPVVWPWGAKSFNFRDTEGNIIVFRSFPEVIK